MNTINWPPFFGRIIGPNIAPLNTYYNQAIDYQDTPLCTVEALLWLFHLNLAACQHVGSFAEKPSSRKLTLNGANGPVQKKTCYHYPTRVRNDQVLITPSRALRVIDHHRSKKQGWPCEPLQTHQKISVNSSSFSRRSLGQMIPRLGLEIEMMINSENAKHRWTPSNTKKPANNRGFRKGIFRCSWGLTNEAGPCKSLALQGEHLSVSLSLRKMYPITTHLFASTYVTYVAQNSNITFSQVTTETIPDGKWTNTCK